MVVVKHSSGWHMKSSNGSSNLDGNESGVVGSKVIIYVVDILALLSI